jgi:chromosome partitioning protein
MKIIAVANQKGGAGKSTTATTLSAGLRALGHKTLIVDMDAQGNATDTARAAGEGVTVYDVLTNKATAAATIRNAGKFGDIIPASARLSKVESELAEEINKYSRLKKALLQVKYDYVIIDTPPSLGTLTINAMMAANGIIIPTGADKYGVIGIEQLRGTFESVKEELNPNLQIYGILFTRHDPRRRLLREYADGLAELAQKMGTQIYSCHIRDCTAIREAQAYRQTIFEYSPKCNGAEDYNTFIKEFLSKNKGRK